MCVWGRGGARGWCVLVCVKGVVDLCVCVRLKSVFYKGDNSKDKHIWIKGFTSLEKDRYNLCESSHLDPVLLL